MRLGNGLRKTFTFGTRRTPNGSSHDVSDKKIRLLILAVQGQPTVCKAAFKITEQWTSHSTSTGNFLGSSN